MVDFHPLLGSPWLYTCSAFELATPGAYKDFFPWNLPNKCFNKNKYSWETTYTCTSIDVRTSNCIPINAPKKLKIYIPRCYSSKIPWKMSIQSNSASAQRERQWDTEVQRPCSSPDCPVTKQYSQQGVPEYLCTLQWTLVHPKNYVPRIALDQYFFLRVLLPGLTAPTKTRRSLDRA